MYRVIWELSDGRKKYISLNGKPELWSEEEINILKRLKYAAYSEDLKKFITDKRFITEIKTIDIVSYELQKSTEPILTNVIL
jgi:hypothetical protein